VLGFALVAAVQAAVATLKDLSETSPCPDKRSWMCWYPSWGVRAMNKAHGQVRSRNRTVGRVQEMLVPEGVFMLLAAAVAVAAREWRRVHLAREQRREREQELLAKMVAEVADGSRDVQVHHGGAAGAWSLTGTGAGGDAAAVSGRTVPARRRR
jgi:hypothetical protein